MGKSSDTRHSYYHESEPACGQSYAAEQDVHVETTQNVTWTPLLRDITLGLSGIESDWRTNVRVKAEAKNQRPDGASIEVTTWHDTKFYWGDANFIAWPNSRSTLEWGTLDTYAEKAKSKKVQFEGCYAVPPTVVVFFWYLDLISSAESWRVAAYAQDVTTTGFTVGARTWEGSKIYGVGVNWIAVPADSKQFRAGTYSTRELHPWNEPDQKHSSSIAFSSSIRDKPTVFTALNLIDMPTSADLRIELTQDTISGKGFDWHIDAWGDTEINVAEAAYVAF